LDKGGGSFGFGGISLNLKKGDRTVRAKGIGGREGGSSLQGPEQIVIKKDCTRLERVRKELTQKEEIKKKDWEECDHFN